MRFEQAAEFQQGRGIRGRLAAQVAEGGIEALFDANRRKPNPKNRVEPSY